ncbi:MAG: cyoC [Ramlibacter sp.]|nr:cyoC [Ramlibacter sp.]
MYRSALETPLAPTLPRAAPTRLGVTGFGFYLYLLSDCIIFATLFAAFAVLHHSVADGPTGGQLFNLRNAFVETACLLTSSVTCGMAMLACDRRRVRPALGALAVTFVLGFVFLALEMTEFAHMASDGAGPSRSAFLSAFFTLVSTHGLHVTAGLVWLVVLCLQLRQKGFNEEVVRRMFCFSLFWHVIDVVWIAVFSFVYLIGSAS